MTQKYDAVLTQVREDMALRKLDIIDALLKLPDTEITAFDTGLMENFAHEMIAQVIITHDMLDVYDYNVYRILDEIIKRYDENDPNPQTVHLRPDASTTFHILIQ